MRFQQQLVAAAMLLATLYFTIGDCDIESYNQHRMSESNQVLLDPSADYEYFTKSGDVTIIKDELKQVLEKHTHSKRSKRLVKKRTTLWENGVIPYSIGYGYSEDDIQVIMKAMSRWESETCIRFKERTNETDYIQFFRGFGCQSFVGRVNGRQGVTLSATCVRQFNLVLHEIGHVIGLEHEHKRHDRDDYVNVIKENRFRGFDSEFRKLNKEDVRDLGFGYDYNSIMHYDSNAFSKNDDPTIVALDPNITVGMAADLSKLDIKKVNVLYDCPAVPPPRSTVYVEPPKPKLAPHPFECGEDFDGIEALNGTLMSPGFPTHQAGQDCMYRIRTPRGYQIRLNILSVGLIESSDCSENYVDLYEKEDCTGYRLGRVCRPNQYRVYYTFRNIGCVRYHSGSSSKSDLTGFKLSFNAEDINECLFSRICSHTCTNIPGGYQCSCPRGYFLSADGRQCFDVNECATNSTNNCAHKCKNYGGYHECICPDGSLQGDRSDCKDPPPHIIIPNPEPQPVVPPFPEPMALTPPTTPPEIILPSHERPSTVPTTQRPTTEKPTPSCSNTNARPVNPPACGGYLTDPAGTFMTPNHPETYNVNEICEWVIQLPDCNKVVELTFNNFSVASQMPTCIRDQVFIMDGVEEGSTTLGPLCHVTPPGPLVFSSNVARIRFVAGPRHKSRRKGFFASYRSVDKEKYDPKSFKPFKA